MKGLLIKDIRLLYQQKATLFMFVAIGLFLLLTGKNALGVVNYMIYVIAIYAMSVIAYDRYDNGMAFLMTLPVSRKDYVMEKYLLTFCSSFLTGVIFMGMAIMISVFSGNAVDTGAFGFELLVSLLFMFVVISVMIPINIKFDSEKSKIVFLIGFGIFFAVIFLLNKMGAKGIEALENALQKLEQLEPVTIFLMGGVLVFGAVCVSIGISVRIMEKKEF